MVTEVFATRVIDENCAHVFKFELACLKTEIFIQISYMLRKNEIGIVNRSILPTLSPFEDKWGQIGDTLRSELEPVQYCIIRVLAQ